MVIYGRRLGGVAVTGVAGAARGTCGGASGVSITQGGEVEGMEGGAALAAWAR